MLLQAILFPQKHKFKNDINCYYCDDQLLFLPIPGAVEDPITEFEAIFAIFAGFYEFDISTFNNKNVIYLQIYFKV